MLYRLEDLGRKTGAELKEAFAAIPTGVTSLEFELE